MITLVFWPCRGGRFGRVRMAESDALGLQISFGSRIHLKALLDMHRVDARSLLEKVDTLTHLLNKEAVGLSARKNRAGQIVTAVHELGLLAGAIGISSLETSARLTMERWREGGFELAAAQDFARHFQELLLRELRQRTFLVLGEDDGELYNQPRRLTREAASVFKAADEELAEASLCLAFERHTAAVFHAMRALEEPLDRMRATLRVKREEQPWGRILIEIKRALDEKPRPKTRPTRERREAFQQATMEFRGFKDAWRNHAMHSGRNYDREEAERILGHVVAFIEDLAPHIPRDLVLRRQVAGP